MHFIQLPAAMILLMASPSRATDALCFNGGGYIIEIVSGHDRAPVVAQVLFTAPNAPNWVDLTPGELKIEKFDVEARVLIIRFKNPGNPNLPGSFTLTIKGRRGVLRIGGKRISGEFDWTT
jgi:hypothetical protein